MKRTLTIIGAALAATVLAAGPASAARTPHLEGHRTDSHVAGHRHNHQAPAHPRHHHDCQVAPKCRPEPLPVPPGGWPCRIHHDCASKHHEPICPPTPPVKPPKHHKPKHHKPTTHHAHSAPPVASDIPQLPRTGAVGDVLLESGLGLGAIALGVVPFVLTRRPKAVADAIRGELS